MILENLSIRKRYAYEANYVEGQYVATIKYTNQSGSVEMQLTPELSRKLLEIVAEDLVVASREVAQTLTAQTLLTTPPKELSHEPNVLVDETSY